MLAVTEHHVSRDLFGRFDRSKRSGKPCAPSVTFVWRPDRNVHIAAGLAGAALFPFMVLASVASGLPFGIASSLAVAHLAAAAPSAGVSERIRLSRILSALAAIWCGLCIITVSAGFAPVTLMAEAVMSLVVAAIPLVTRERSTPVDFKTLTARELACLENYSIGEAVIVTDETGRLLGSTWAARSRIDELDRRCKPEIHQLVDIADRPAFSSAMRDCVQDRSTTICRVAIADSRDNDIVDLRLRAIGGGRIAINVLQPSDSAGELPFCPDPVEQARSGRLQLPGPDSIPKQMPAEESISADLCDVAEFVMRLTHQDAEKAGIKVELTVTERDMIVACDRRALIQIIINVLNNAIKFSNYAGCVTIGIGHENGSALVRIVDQGIGIAPEDRQRVFGSFNRSGDKSRAGHGLGLSIVRDLVDRANGSIQLTSEIGLGTEVEISLPLQMNGSTDGHYNDDRLVFDMAAE